jgi:small conductance mechanosensitive channel
MTPPLAVSWSGDVTQNVTFVLIGVFVFIVFVVASRFIARFVAHQLHRRQVRADMVVLGRRVVTVAVIGLGIFISFSFALQSANVTLLGIVLATVVAALGVQDLLKDYVSGYYVLIERHFRVGDRIALDERAGTVVDVKLRVTLLRTEAGDLIVVPNSELFTRPVTVYAKGSPDAHAATEAKSEPPA